MKFKLSEEQRQQILQNIKKVYDWIKETVRKIMKPIVGWIKKNYVKVNYIIQRQKAYLKYKRRVENRQVLYFKRRRIYGK
ncbi:hypothetical protein [Clostridium butyricum]|uniref:hypothetical protein n=1 Tax=Clostridium butyricum TaxID=1492 RepID=UPI00374EC1EB